MRNSFNMNKYILFSFLLIGGMTSCENFQAQYEEEQKRQQLMNEMLVQLEEEERIMKGEYAETLELISEIEDSLQSIASRNKKMDELIRQKNLTDDDEQQQRIIAQLNALQKANEQTSLAANQMRSKAKAYKVENLQIKNMIAGLEQKFIEKEAELGELQTTIGNLKSSLQNIENEISSTESSLADAYADLKVKTDNLEATNTKLQTTIDDLNAKNQFIEDDANAYVTCGTPKVLRENKIITLLSMKRLTKDYQKQVKELGSQVSIFDNNEVECGDGEIVYILPERDPNSYQIEGNKIIILDKKMFWTTSKALVVVKK